MKRPSRGKRVTEGTARRRGRPNLVDRERILGAAVELERELGVDGLNMTNVADRLGVNRTTLNYHIRSRDELVELVAGIVLEFNMDARWMPADNADWREWVRAFATELRRSLLAHQPLALYFRFPPGAAPGALDQADRFFGRLFTAGFHTAEVSKTSTYVAQVVFMSVRDELMARTKGRHPQDDEMQRALERIPEGEMSNLRRFMASGGRAGPEEQFAFNLDCTIAGLEAQLAQGRPRG